MSTKCGIWTGYYLDLDLAGSLRHLANLGWQHVEVSSEHLEAILADDDVERQLADVASVAQDCQVTMWQAHVWLGLDVAPGDRVETQRQIDIARRWLDAVDSLGIVNAVIHPGGLGRLRRGETSEEQVFADNVDAYARLAAHIEGTEVRLCVENMTARLGTAEELWALARAVDSPQIGFCLDTGHAHLGGLSVPDMVLKLGERLWASHIADNDTSGDQHLFPYGGTIDWPPVVEAYRQIDYRGL